MVTRAVRRAVFFGLFLRGSLATAEEPTKAFADAASSPAAVAAPTAAAPGAPPVFAEPPSAWPGIYHAPLVVARPGAPLAVAADISERHLVRHAFVVYRTAGSTRFRAVELLRASGATAYAAEIPALNVSAPFLEYTIEVELVDGRRFAAFASRETPHHVAVPEDYMDLREKALLSRLDGRRVRISMGGEYVSFGHSSTRGPGGGRISDRYFSIDGAFTYRPLRTVTEFSLRVDLLRGASPISTTDELDVGFNYSAATVRVRLADAWHLDVEGLTALTDVGFRLGGGSQLLVGDPYGSKLALGLEGIADFGARFWSRVDIPVGERVLVSPIVEATSFAHADRYGIRLLGEVAARLRTGLDVAVSGGYQAREAVSGGPAVGVRIGQAF